MNLIKLLTGRKTKRPSYAVEGWVARNGFYSDPLESRLQFFISKPERVQSDRVEWWGAGGFRCRLPEHFFPKLRWEHEPVKVRLEVRYGDWKEDVSWKN